MAAARAPYRAALRRAADAYGEIFVFNDDGYEHIDKVATDLTDTLEEAGVYVINMRRYTAAAAAGVRDQILQTGVGRRKAESADKRVKTGASDSTSFRLLEAHARDESAKSSSSAKTKTPTNIHGLPARPRSSARSAR